MIILSISALVFSAYQKDQNLCNLAGEVGKQGFYCKLANPKLEGTYKDHRVIQITEWFKCGRALFKQSLNSNTWGCNHCCGEAVPFVLPSGEESFPNSQPLTLPDAIPCCSLRSCCCHPKLSGFSEVKKDPSHNWLWKQKTGPANSHLRKSYWAAVLSKIQEKRSHYCATLLTWLISVKHNFSEPVYSYRKRKITEPPVTSVFHGTCYSAKLSA